MFRTILFVLALSCVRPAIAQTVSIRQRLDDARREFVERTANASDDIALQARTRAAWDDTLRELATAGAWTNPADHRALAEIHSHLEQWDRAANHASLALAAGPADVDLHALRVTALLMAGQLDEAERAAAEAVRAHPDSPQIHLAALKVASGLIVRAIESNDARDAERRLSDARKTLDRILTIFPHQLLPWAAMLRQFDQFDERIKALREGGGLVGKPAASLVPDAWLNSDPLGPEALQGKVVLLDFWAVWCGPCIATFPHLRRWHEEWSDKGLAIVGVTNYCQYGWNETREQAEQVPNLTPEAERAAMRAFLKHHRLNHAVAMMPDSALAKYYGVGGIPHFVLIDRAGKVRMVHIGGGRMPERFESCLLACLKEPAPGGTEPAIGQAAAVVSVGAIKDSAPDAERLWREAQGHRSAGEFREALAAGEQVLTIERALATERANSEGADDKRIERLAWLASTAMEQRDFPAAAQRFGALREALTALRGERSDDAIDAWWDEDFARRLSELDPPSRQALFAAVTDHAESEHGAYAGNALKALPLVEQAAKTFSRILGPDHPLHASALIDLSARLRRLNQNEQAVATLREAIDISRKTVGKTHAQSLRGLEALASIFEATQDYARAAVALGELRDATAAVYGLEHRKTVEVEFREFFASRMRKLSRAEQEEMLEAGRLHSLHFELCKAKNFEEVLKNAERERAIYERLIGKENQLYAQALIHLAVAHTMLKNRDRGMPLIEEVVDILDRCGARGSPLFPSYLSILTAAYTAKGDNARAYAINRRYKAQEQFTSFQHVNWCGLGDVALSMGDFALAERYYLGGDEYGKKLGGEGGGFRVYALTRLSWLNLHKGDFDRAESFYRQALEIQKDVGEEKPAQHAERLILLAAICEHRNENAEAESSLRSALQIKASLRDDHAMLDIGAMQKLGALYARQGDVQRAENMMRRALEIETRLGGEPNLATASILFQAADFYETAQQLPAKAEPLYRRSLEITLDGIEANASGQSERQQLAMKATAWPRLRQYMGFLRCTGRGVAEAYPFWLRWKGQIARRERQLRALRDDPALRPQVAELERVTARLAQRALANVLPDTTSGGQTSLTELSRQKEELERVLAEKNATFRASLRPPTAADIQAALPPDAVLLDFAQQGSVLSVFVVKRDAPVRSIDLDASPEVLGAIDVWRKDFGRSAVARQAGALLRERLWTPIEAHLAGAKLVLVSPDGSLGRLPFLALPGRNPGGYLLEDWPLVIVPTPAELPESPPRWATERSESSPRLLAIGAVDYEAAGGTRKAPSRPPIEDDIAQRGPPRGENDQAWRPLGGTRGELATLAEIYQRRFGSLGLTTLADSAASEEALRELAPRQNYLHLATHGFFAADRFQSALRRQIANNDSTIALSAPPPVFGFHPGLLSGIVLAGANHARPDGQDGYLTAEEVLTLDLRGVRLCVLSACETGLGKVADGEGLLGLQRAFHAAGARTVVASLWQVDDQATLVLMRRFYENLWDRKLSPLDALRDAQLAMLRHYDPQTRRLTRGAGEQVAFDAQRTRLPLGETSSERIDPFYWAAFVLSGDWR